MKVIKWKSVFRLLVDGMLCPWLFIIFMLTAGIVTVSQPFVFKVLYYLVHLLSCYCLVNQ